MSSGLSKSNLLAIKNKTKTYEGFLPALNLRKEQILLKLAEVESKYNKVQAAMEVIYLEIKEKIPMFAASGISWKKFIKLKAVKRATINVVGIKIPAFLGVEIKKEALNFSTLPFWSYFYLMKIEEYLRLRIKFIILQEQKDILKKASIKVTQKINLFEKVLLPKNYAQMKKIKIFLEDNDRAGIVSCKIAKKKRQGK